MSNKIIVLDDDPTGSQTVHSCQLLLSWQAEDILQGLEDNAPLFFILTNTRAYPAEQAAKITQEVCDNIKIALDLYRQKHGNIPQLLFISRSDSTLRGHYPLETDIIADRLGPFDAHFLIPAFFEGGRITKDSVHYIKTAEQLIPVHETEFAKDHVFSYSHSYLPDYVEEKTKGLIKAEQVIRFLLQEVQGKSLDKLLALQNNACCVVDAEIQADLDQFAMQLQEATTQGKRFLLRSGASIVKSLAHLPPQPIAAQDMSQYVRNQAPGGIIVGSYVQKTTLQLEKLFEISAIVPIEVTIEPLLEDEKTITQYLQSLITQIEQIHQAGKTFVIYTQRQKKTFTDPEIDLAFGNKVSQFLMDLVKNMPQSIGFLISKGGITSNDVLSKGLALKSATVLGQILGGCSVVCCPETHSRYPLLPVVIFPGNVGDEYALATVYQRLVKKV